MHTTALFPRKTILNALGFMQNASRSSWSHDDGERVFFDAWTNRYSDDGRYPMCTRDAYPRPNTDGLITVGGVTESPRRGHVMWLAHLDLVLSGQRQAILINPVPREAGPRQGDKGAKGWMPRYSTGSVSREDDGVWFTPEEIITLDLEQTIEWQSGNDRPNQNEESIRDPDGDPLEEAKQLLERHLRETTEMLKQISAR